MENVYYVVKGYAKNRFSYYVILDDSKNLETVTFQTRLTGLAGRFINVIGEQSKLLLGIKYKPPIDVRIVRLPDYIRADKLEEMNDNEKDYFRRDLEKMLKEEYKPTETEIEVHGIMTQQIEGPTSKTKIGIAKLPEI